MQDLPPQIEPTSSRARRLRLALLVPVVSILLLSALVFGIQRLSRPAPADEPAPALAAAVPSSTATPPPAPTRTPVPTATPISPTPTDLPLPTATPTPTVPPEDVVALINGRMVTSETVQLVQGVDEAMADLLDRPTEAAETLLDRVVNLALVAQVADEAGFELEPGTVVQFRDAMLAENGRSLDALTAALAQRQISLAQFDAYLGQLLRTDQFLRQEAAATDSTAAQVLADLQAQARISLGPLAAQLLPAPTPTPEPTIASALTETPAPDEEVTIIRSRGTGVGQLLPDFALPLAGDADALVTADSLIGQPTVISFFTTWCPYCKRQTPVLVDAFSRYDAQGVRFVGVDVKEAAGLVLPYVQENGIAYPVILDESGSTAATYGVPGYPTTYFLDAQGQIVDRHIGALTEELLDGYLARIIVE